MKKSIKIYFLKFFLMYYFSKYSLFSGYLEIWFKIIKRWDSNKVLYNSWSEDNYKKFLRKLNINSIEWNICNYI